jgi:hypothetical protein
MRTANSPLGKKNVGGVLPFPFLLALFFGCTAAT